MPIPSNTTTISGVTKKSQYDTLYDNAILCDTGGTPGGAQTVPGVKTFTDGLKVENISAINGDGLYLKDDGGNIGLFIEDGGNAIGLFTDDVESWDASMNVLESYASTLMLSATGIYTYWVSNAYYDGSWKYKTTNVASMITLNANGSIIFYTKTSGTADAVLTWDSKFKIDNATDSIGIGGYAGGSNRDARFYFASDAYFQWFESTNELYFLNSKIFVTDDIYTDNHYPNGPNAYESGNASNYWTEVNAKDFTDRSAIWMENPDQAYELIRTLRNEEEFGFCANVESRGQHRSKYSHFPDYCWDDALEEINEDVNYEDTDEIDEKAFESQNRQIPQYQRGDKIVVKGEKTRLRVKKQVRKNKQTGEQEEYRKISIAAEGFKLSAGISILFGAVQKCIHEIENLKSSSIRGV